MTMTLNLFLSIFVFLMTLGYIQSEEKTYQGFALWSKSTNTHKVKETQATFNEEFLPAFKESMPVEEKENITKEEMKSLQEKFKSNRLKRDTDYEDASISSSIELKNSEEDSEEMQNLHPKEANISKQSIKRQTSVIGNGNRLSNLINLPVRLNVLANVLSKLNQGVLDHKETPLASNGIVGNDNTVSSLVNAPVDVDAVVNLLSKVDRTKPGSADGGNQGGLVDGLLGGLLGAGSDQANKGLVGGLLDGLLGDNLLGDVLGNTLGDLLAALLTGDGLVGNLLGGLDGKGLVAELLQGLLGGVVELVEQLLELLVGLLNGLLAGIKGPEEAATGLNNHVSSLTDSPKRIKALISSLTALKLELNQLINPAAAPFTSLGNSPINLEGTGPQAFSSDKSGSSLLGSLLGSPPSSATGSNSIQGDNNALSSLLNVVPDVHLNLNLLSQITDLLVGKDGTNEAPAGVSLNRDNPNEICFEIPINQADNTITGDNNKISNTINVKPKINLDLNLLSKVNKADSPNTPVQRVCITRPIQPLAPLPPAPIPSAPLPSAPIISLPSAPLPLAPHPSAPLPSVPLHSSSLGSPPLFPPKLTIPSQPLPVHPHPASPTPPNVKCFDVLVDQSGNVVSGNNNEISSLVNVNPNINLDLNLLSDVTQTNPQSHLIMKTICIPEPAVQNPAAIFPPIQAPVGPAAIFPTNQAPVGPAADSRCFRRTCTRWKQFVDHNCIHKPNEYPKYTLTRDI